MIYFVDPMSYSNLAIYDYSLLCHNKDMDILFFGSSLYNYKKIAAPTKFIPLFNYNKKRTLLRKVLSYIQSICRLMVLVKKNKPDLIHIQWIKFWYLDILFLLYLKMLKIKVVYTAHNVVPHESVKYVWMQYKFYYKYTTDIIVHTYESKQRLIKDFSVPFNKIHVIPHGTLDLSSERTAVQIIKDKIKKELNIENQIVFSILGLQSFYKGSDMVVKLWAENIELHDKNKFYLLFLGKNNKIDTSSLENIENVNIVNQYISNEEFLAALQLTSVLLMPYRAISQSGVLLTAINESVPFLVSSAGSLSEPLSLAKVGWCMGEPNYENLKNSVLAIAKQKQEILKIKNDRKSWAILQKVFAWDNIAMETFRIYKK